MYVFFKPKNIYCSEKLTRPVLFGILLQIHILLPPLTKLRTVAEHMRQLADVLEVRVGRRGELRFAVDTDDVTVETAWTRCVMPNMGGGTKKKQQDGNQGEDENTDGDQEEADNEEEGGRIQPERGSDDTQEEEEEDGEDEESDGEDEGANDGDFDPAMDERQQRRRASNKKGKRKAKDMDKSFSVRLSVRAFLKFLSVHVVSSTTIACAFTPAYPLLT